MSTGQSNADSQLKWIFYEYVDVWDKNFVEGDMKELFKDLLSVDGIKGIVLFSSQGEVLFKTFLSAIPEEPEARDWALFFDSINKVRESDLIFQDGRMYIRKTELGFLVILMRSSAPVALVRLNCDVLLPSLKPAKTSKGFGRFFKR